MLKKILLISLILSPFIWAQDGTSTADRLARKKYDEDQRQDEYANSLRRRDWLKDRLIIGPGLGTKYSMMGKEGFGFGAAIEYITAWHLAPFMSYGFVFKKTDPSFDTLFIGGGTGARAGLSYYLFPKSPLHLALSASYGNVYFDNNMAVDSTLGFRPMIHCKGWEGDVTISYLTNEWYFLNAIVGMYYVGPKLPGTRNNSEHYDAFEDKNVGSTLGSKKIPNQGLVFGLGIGFALPDLFPDETEKRRRKRDANSAYDEN